MLEFDTLFGRFVCAFAAGLGMRSGNLGDAVNLCVFIFKNDL